MSDESIVVKECSDVIALTAKFHAVARKLEPKLTLKLSINHELRYLSSPSSYCLDLAYFPFLSRFLLTCGKYMIQAVKRERSGTSSGKRVKLKS